MDRKLVSIQRINDINPIENADRLELANVLGWHCVVKKDEFNPGDLCLFYEIDSIVPEIPYFEFMKRYKYRVKTQKLRGVLSQGLCVPLMDLSQILVELDNTGQNITELVSVVKYEEPSTLSTDSNVKGSFPSFIPKTDEIRIQAIPEILGVIKNKDTVITEKLDGTSCTIYRYNEGFGVCSRNLEKQESDECIYWHVAKKYNLQDNMPYGYAIQGEIIGPKIQGNRYKLDTPDIYIFSVFDIKERKYLDYWDTVDFIEPLSLHSVPFLGIYKNMSIEILEAFSQRASVINYGLDIEGIVVRPIQELYDPRIGRVSFKVINPKYLLKYQDK